MALQLARSKEIKPPESSEGSPRHRLAGSAQEHEQKIDAGSLLASALEQWRDEHAILCQRQLEARGVPLESAPPSLHLELSGHIPDLDKMDTALAMGRRVDVQFIPNRDGDATICVHHPESGEMLSFPCCVEVMFREKEVGDAEAGLLRQAFQMSLAARANTFFNRMVSEVDGDHTTPRPVFVVASDPDLARALWTPSESAQGFSIRRGGEAQRALTQAAEGARPNARDVETSDFVVIVLPYLKVTDEYRLRICALARDTYRAYLSPTSRAASLLSGPSAIERDFLEMIDNLLGVEIGAQAAKDPSANAYAKRVGADSDAIKERTRNKRESEAAAAQKLEDLRREVRSICGGVISNEAIPQQQRNLMVNTQVAVLAALAKGRTELAFQTIKDARSRASQEIEQPLSELQQLIETQNN